MKEREKIMIFVRREEIDRRRETKLDDVVPPIDREGNLDQSLAVVIRERAQYSAQDFPPAGKY